MIDLKKPGVLVRMARATGAFLSGLLLAGCATGSGQWATLDGDEPTTKVFLETELAGSTLLYGEGFREEYHDNGRYTYISADGRRYDARGVYFTDNGARCILYPNGERCDLYVLRDGNLTLINRRGDSFRVASIE